MEITASATFELESRHADRRRWVLRVGSIALTLIVAGAWFQFLRPSSLGGPATYVIVSGTSMLPTLESGDLVIAFDRESYAVGDVVVYRVPSADPGAGTQIVHRIVGRSQNGSGYLVQGDNREGPDYWRPASEEVVGKMQLRIPRAGNALVHMRTPLGIALIAALTTLLIALGASTKSSNKTSADSR
ncbi:MAG: signal peptidase I [Gaiellaceae bacterium]